LLASVSHLTTRFTVLFFPVFEPVVIFVLQGHLISNQLFVFLVVFVFVDDCPPVGKEGFW
jgi:hypothetical protein